MKIHFHFITAALCLFLYSCQPYQNIPLQIPQIFSDHMVLQQQREVDFWGEYTPGHKVTIFASWGAEITTNADADGQWKMKLLTPNAGGPYSITIESRDSTIVLKDVLVGEVWLASGQSNMEMPLRGWPPKAPILDSSQEIAAANYPNIRMFTVARNLSSNPLNSLTGKWASASSETAGYFSATAYFFARRLHREIKVPIGIIHSSWGGTVAEAWTSEQRLRNLGDFDEMIDRVKKTGNWYQQFPAQELPETDEQWESISFPYLAAAETEFDDSQWGTIELPGKFDQLYSSEFDGAVLLRRTFTIEDVAFDYVLMIESIDDRGVIYINGQKIGGLAGAGFLNTTREMAIPKSLLVQGRNTIAIRAIDLGGPGAVSGPLTISNSMGDEISIEGSWKYQVIAEIFMDKLYVYEVQVDISERPDVFQLHPKLPTVLFNAMINPLVPYTISGAIWYQGEGNVGRDEQYKQLFPTMIEDWRSKWGYDFPFYFVQIAPYIYNKKNPAERVSPKLRDAQRYSLKAAKTGMVVTLDIGNPINIHPANKQDVGMRLAGLALANDYGKDLVASGPLYKQVEKSDDTLTIEFNHVGSGLVASDTGLSGFEIAGADKIYVSAQAKIVDNKVEVMNPSVASPEYARYAWRDDSVATLFNLEGLPASSFTSED